MAKLFLEAGDKITVSDSMNVLGSTGAETLLISGTPNVTVNGNVDRVELVGNVADYKFEAVGTNVLVYSGSTLVATIDAQDDANGTQIAFKDGSAFIVQTGLDAFTLGGVAVPQTTGGAALVAPVLDPADPSTVAPPTPAVPTFSVVGASSVTEGNTATFTVALSSAQGIAQTVNYTLEGTGGAVLGTDTGTAVPGNTGTLTFAPGETTKTITVPVTFDTTPETGEGLKVTLASPSTGTALGTATTVTTTIADTPAPTFTLTSNTVAGTPTLEGNTIVFTVTPSGMVDVNTVLTVNLTGATVGGITTTASPADFTPNTQTFTFAAGTTAAQTMTVTVVSDSTTEGIEGYKASLLDSTFTEKASVTGTINDSTVPGGTGQSYTLTTGADTPANTSGNDTYIGLVDATTPANATLSAADTINGGDGTGDALNITTQAAGAIASAVNGALVSNIETINLRATGAGGVALDMNNVLGATLVNNNLSTDALTLTNVKSTTALTITGNTSVTNGATTATYDATATAGAVTLNGGTTAGAVAVNGAGFTSFTVNSTGATNVIGALSSSGTAIAATTINATTAFETTGLTVGTVPAGGQTLTVSGAAGPVAATATVAAKSAVTLGAFDADFVTINASGLTAGGVSGTLSATTAAKFTGGAGTDRITTSTSGQTGAIDAAGGTDVLTLANSVDIDTTAEGAIYKNFEVLTVGNGVSIDMDLITGSTIGAVALVDTAAGATVVTDMTATQAANFTIAALNGAATIGIKNATQVGTLDTLTIAVTDGDTTGSETNTAAGDLTIAGIETISITATDDLTLATMANITGLTSLTVAGGGDVSITTLVHVASANESVNFSALTTASTFNFAGTTTNALAFTGGSGIDTVTDSVIGGNVISTGAGRDVITLTAKTGGTAASTITMGTGGDALDVTLAKGNDAQDLLTLIFAAGDSVIDSSTAGTGFVAATMDAITGIDLANAAAAAAGHVITFDTAQTATAVTFGSSAMSFGTTTVTNAFDFYVYNTGAGGITYAYQDTDGDKIIENGEFGIQLTGVAATATTSGEFTISATGGNLVLTTA